VQESLTNARKHAPGARVGVTARYGERGAEVAVVDDGRVAGGAGDDAMAATGGGAGLAGLEERVAMVGGVLRAGPEPGGGFAVRATLPAFVPTTSPRATA
jgi:signal transduction histidine kinase